MASDDCRLLENAYKHLHVFLRHNEYFKHIFLNTVYVKTLLANPVTYVHMVIMKNPRTFCGYMASWANYIVITRLLNKIITR